MRLHSLSMTAFGPFAGTEVVDFDLLCSSGVFLLHGPTGAGKTSVLDAVCYALYGQLPGDRAAGRLRLRSDHAPADRGPRVQLELTVSGRRLEITRSPEWVRPKKRGSGVTTAPAATSVRELVDGEWSVLTTRNDEAAHLLLDLLGMGHEQFTKVVLLPQGDFAAFLRADAEQRRALLSRLFSIDRFAGVEEWLQGERRRLVAEVEAGVQRTAGLVARANEAFAGLPHTDDVVDVGDLDGKPAQLVAALLQRAESLSSLAQSAVESQSERVAAARTALAGAIEVAGRRARWLRATHQLEALDSRSVQHAEDVRSLAAARRAAPLAELVEARHVARSEAADVARALESARRAVPVALRGDDDEALRALVRGHRTALGELQAASARLAELAAIHDRIALLSHESATAAAGVASATADCQRADVELARASEAQQLWARGAADLGPATDAAAQAEQVVRLVTDLGRVQTELAEATEAKDRAVADEQAARDHHLRLWERRLADIAGELAGELVTGEPCRVCGSCDHPAPAALPDDHVRRAAVDEAARAAKGAATERQLAHERQQVLRNRAAELAALTGGRDERTAAADLSAALARVAAATEAGSGVEREAAAAALAVAKREASTARLQQLTGAASATATSLAELCVQRDLMVADLERLRGADVDVTTRRQRLEREAVALESLLDALAAARVAERALTAAGRRLTAACRRHGFADEREALGAILVPARLVELADAVAAHERSRAAQLAVLAEPELLGVDGLPEPPVEQLRTEVTRADSELQRRRSAATLSLDVVRRLAELARLVADHEDAAAPARNELDRVDQLTTCVLGTGADNQLRMRLSAYVLAARLEEVAAAATERLTAMSDGRYSLVHSDERAKGGGRSGLGLRVVDAWTGVERETSTLSGGESFLASLALALGLADVVQAEAAGSPIETLFVDEGFGTLDEDTLEEVMALLDGLRDGGRAVGLVSHVVDLRARIPAQLEVRKTRAGSTLVQHDVGVGDCTGRAG